MATLYNPSIVRNGLVLHFDAANERSYGGDATTNLITTNPLPTAESTTGYSAQGGTGNPITYDSAKQAIYWQRDTYEPWGAYCPNSTNFTGTLNTSLQYTASFEWYSESEFFPSLFTWELVNGPGTNYVTSANVLSNSISIGGGWYRFSFTFTPAITGINANFRVIINNQGTAKTRFWWRKLQLEQKSYRTPFVEGTRSATWTDLSGNGNNGTLTNGLTYNSFNGGSIVFDGTNKYVQVSNSNSINLSSQLTLSFYIKKNIDNRMYFIDKHLLGADGFFGYIDSNNSIFFRFGSNQILTNSNVVSNNQWFYITITGNSTQRSIFINENNIVTIFGSNTWNQTNEPLFIGNTSANEGAINGNLANLFLYNRLLTQAEVAQNYNATKGRYGL